MSVNSSEYLSLAEVMSRINSYMASRGYNPKDYEAISIGNGSCLFEDSVIIWYYSFYLREYANPNHEININIPCYKTDSHISCELLSREFGVNKE